MTLSTGTPSGLSGGVIVTGAAQGIGERIARTLHARGYQVFLADIQTEKVAAVADDLGVGWSPVDICDPDKTTQMVESAIAAMGRVGALVNVAGIDGPYRASDKVDPEHWRTIIDADLSGPWWCIQSVLPHMLAQGGGRIVSIASIAGVIPCEGISVAYAAAKAGVIGMTMSLAQDLESRGILVNSIAPGVIGTTGEPMPPGELEKYREDFALGEGGPQPVADAVDYLLSDSGRWISGTVMNVTGGFWRGR
ncbi:pyridoxal 4-dehydrogenase [Mycolicibacterium anyangense]|uniref:Pyridoxal 4-dehydrogenase n=1 Tax=Mycolicibacterium anyangense TaxID=1431246 RepID=A0A6N4WHH2_9MYCO|nr:SDR family oxidoreductase [Mycolicibacterium anyangense]BBZ78661.1 pyridoxal 4-dehydrogenase [Mycolicibacterium anyangense]